MTPKKAKKTVDSYRERVSIVRSSLNELEDNYLSSRNSREYVVNVKRSDDFVEVGDIFELIEEKHKRKLSYAGKQWLKEQLEFNDAWHSWLGVEREYVIQGLFGGMTLSSPEHWRAVLHQIDDEVPTSYPAINGLATIEEKRETISQWSALQSEDRLRLDLLSRFEPSWCGRSGGYFTLIGAYTDLEDYWEDLNTHFEDVDEAVESMRETQKGEKHPEPVMAFYGQQLSELSELVTGYEKLANAVLWFMKQVDDYNQGLDFKVELFSRAEEEISSMRHDNVLPFQDEEDKRAEETAAEHSRTLEITTLEERDRWDGQLYRHNDKDGDLVSLGFFPNGSPGMYGECEQFLIELPEEDGIKEFCDFLTLKRLECLRADEERNEQAAEDEAAMEGY